MHNILENSVLRFQLSIRLRYVSQEITLNFWNKVRPTGRQNVVVREKLFCVEECWSYLSPE